MTLKELIEALKLEGEAAKTLTAEFNAREKQVNEYKEKVEKADKEVATLKEDKEKYDIVVKAFKLDTKAEDFDKMLDDVKDSFMAGDKKTADDFKELNRELTRTKRELENSKKENEKITAELGAEKEARIKSVKQSAILKELQANNVIKAEQWVSRFYQEANLDEDGKGIFMKDEAGKEITLKDGIAEWAKANPEFVQVNVKGGAGSGAGYGSDKESEEFIKSIIGEDGGGEQKSLGELFG